MDLHAGLPYLAPAEWLQIQTSGTFTTFLEAGIKFHEYSYLYNTDFLFLLAWIVFLTFSLFVVRAVRILFHPFLITFLSKGDR